MGFTVAYSAVSWTAGDVITEAKLDAMVANDQAYDSHSAQGFEIDEMAKPSTPAANKVRLYAKDKAGVSTLYYLKDDGTEVELGTAATADGWTPADQTWTRESDNSFSEPIDATLKYQKGDKIRYKQGAGYKYQYIINVGDYSGGKTIMTTTGGSDYVFTNAVAITDNYYSHQENPIGFPYWFATATPSFDLSQLDNGSGGQPQIASSIFRCFNSNIQIRVRLGGDAVKVGEGKVFNFTIPATLPNLIGLDLDILGSCYLGALDIIGSSSRKSVSTIYFFSSYSIPDNTVLPSSNCDAVYRF